MPRSRQPSFASGEITPALHSRVDAEQYLSAVALAENWFVSVYGGLLNRPGTRLVDESGLPSRLIPFQLTEDQGYICELADGETRFYSRGGPLVVDPVSATINPFVAPLPARWRNLSTGGASVTNVPQLRQLSGALGTPGGNNTEGGGPAAAFDGQSDTISALCANASNWVGSVHKDWGTNRQVVGFRLFGSRDLGLTGRRQSVTVQLIGSSNNFGTDYRVLGSWEVNDEPGIVIDRTINTVTAPTLRYHAVVVLQQQTGADLVSIAEVEFSDLALDTPGLALNGAAGSECSAEQEVTTSQPNREHVLTWYMASPGGINLRIGHASLTETIRPLEYFPSGWATAAFTPRVSPFFVRFDHADPMTRVFDGRTRFLNSGGSAPISFSIPQPYGNSDLPGVTFTQDSNRLTLATRRYQPLELSRGAQPLTWKLALKTFGPQGLAPFANALGIQRLGPTTSPLVIHTYVVTYVGADGEETLPSAPIAAEGIVNLTTADYIRITIAQPLPGGVAACNVYKLLGGSYGLMGLCVAQFDDTGQVPKVDQAPPQDRNPFAASPPACTTYWEQRLALAGSDAAAETVDLSQPGKPGNFGRSSPPRADDAITFTPAGPAVRRIKHMISTADLAMFTDAGVIIARRGQDGLTPTLDGGVRQVLTRGISGVRPLIVDSNLVFVGSDGRTVRLLDPDYQDAELSLQAEHLFRGRQVVDWCWQEAPWSLLWLVMSDGRVVILSLLPKQGVIGWTRAVTDGEVKSIACIRESGADRVYLRCRRWLRGAWRNTVEILAERQLSDVRDSFFVDCGLTYDVPLPIALLETINPGRITVSRSGIAVGDEVDLDGTGLDGIDGRRLRVTAVAGSVVTLAADWSGLGPWRGEGFARRCVSTVTGLGHLEGMKVSVLNTGNVEDGHTVTGGAITLQRAGTRVHVGLPFVSSGRTLAIAQEPEGFGRRKAVREVQALVRDTRALEFGPNFERMDVRKARGVERFSEPIGFKTTTDEITLSGLWGLGGQVCFRQRLPLPAELLAISPSFEGSSG